MRASNEIKHFKTLFAHEAILYVLGRYSKIKTENAPDFIDILLNCADESALLDQSKVQLDILKKVVSTSRSLQDKDEADKRLIQDLMEFESIKRILELIYSAELSRSHTEERTDYLLCIIVQLWKYQLLDEVTFTVLSDTLQQDVIDNKAWATQLSRRLIAYSMGRRNITSNIIVENIGIFPLNSDNLDDDHTAVKMKLISLLRKSRLLTNELTNFILNKPFYVTEKGNHATYLIQILEILSEQEQQLLLNQERLERIFAIKPVFWVLYNKILKKFKEIDFLYDYYSESQTYVDLLLSLDHVDCVKLTYCLIPFYQQGLFSYENLNYVLNFKSKDDPHCEALINCMLALNNIDRLDLLSKSADPARFSSAVSLLAANGLASENNIDTITRDAPSYHSFLLSVLNNNKLLNQNNLSRVLGHRDADLLIGIILSCNEISQDLLEKFIQHPDHAGEYITQSEEKKPPVKPDSPQNKPSQPESKPPQPDNIQPDNDDGGLVSVLNKNNLNNVANLDKLARHTDLDLFTASILAFADQYPVSQEIFDELVEHPDRVQLLSSLEELNKLNFKYEQRKLENDNEMKNWPILLGFFKWKNSLGWQWDAGKLRHGAWDKLVEELQKLDDDDHKTILIEHALGMRLFNEHRSNYLYREGSDTHTVELIKQVQGTVSKHKQALDKFSDKDDEFHVYDRRKMN